MIRPPEEPPLPNPSAETWTTATGGVADKVARFLATADRVSVAVRFGNGVRLAEDGDAEIARLAGFVKESAELRRLVLLGFSDMGEGDLAASVRLSERRASLVERRLKALGLDVEQAFGLGPLRPIVCGGPPPVRARNRRVEAWLL
jgi:outer membrane protein OmpA-like peptidoglycan-associated protein